MSGIRAVYGNMDDGAHLMTLVPSGTDAFHQLGVAHIHGPAVHCGLHSLAGNLLHILHAATVILVAERRLQRNGYRMCGIAFHMGSEMQ